MGQLLTGYSMASESEIVSNLSETPPDDIGVDDILGASEKGGTPFKMKELEDILSLDSNRTNQNLHIKYKLTLNQVTEIESKLDIYEKVSLVFLLYEDNYFIALQDLEMYILGTKKDLLYNWAYYEETKGNIWRKKLIEGLCIIQDYEILKSLGYNKDDLCSYFLPTSEYSMYTSESIDKNRKLLYLTCDRLTSEQTKTFLSLVKDELSKRELDIKAYDSAYLEMYLLHWITIDFISPSNVENIICIFKQMGLDDICQLLKLIHNSEQISDRKESSLSTESKSSNCITHSYFTRTDTYTNQNVVDQSLHGERSHRESKSSDSISEYSVDPKKPGYCFIINQKTFFIDRDEQYKNLLPPEESRLEERVGTDIDVDRLTKTFKYFGYEVQVFTDLKHYDILPSIQQALNTVTDESSVFLCILSHGTAGAVYGTNSCRVSIDDIKNVMCNTNIKHLRNKPKFLILQFCQGTNCQKIEVSCHRTLSTYLELTVAIETEIEFDVEDNASEDGELLSHDGLSSAPKLADLFTMYATVKGYSAIRHKKHGTWFIKSLCEQMMELGNKAHFEDICTSVTREVSSHEWKKKNEILGMLPEKISTLRWPFYLPIPVQSPLNN